MVDKNLRCPECGSNKLVKYGKKWSKRKRVQQYSCNNCGRSTVHPKRR